MEKLHCQSALKKRMLQHLINVIDYLSTPLNAQHNYKKTKKPRAGFAPAACCLRGSRSTGLSYRGTTDANNTEPIFKSSQTPTLKALNNP
jgi:hypothetical protein